VFARCGVTAGKPGKRGGHPGRPKKSSAGAQPVGTRCRAPRVIDTIRSDTQLPSRQNWALYCPPTSDDRFFDPLRHHQMASFLVRRPTIGPAKLAACQNAGWRNGVCNEPLLLADIGFSHFNRGELGSGPTGFVSRKRGPASFWSFSCCAVAGRSFPLRKFSPLG
jgi:hypothetical protein